MYGFNHWIWLQPLYSSNCLERQTPMAIKMWFSSQDRWSLATGLTALKFRTIYEEYLVFADKWSVMAVVSQDRFTVLYVPLQKISPGRFQQLAIVVVVVNVLHCVRHRNFSTRIFRHLQHYIFATAKARE